MADGYVAPLERLEAEEKEKDKQRDKSMREKKREHRERPPLQGTIAVAVPSVPSAKTSHH